MTDNVVVDPWARIRSIVKSLPPQEANRLVDIVEVVAGLLNPKPAQPPPILDSKYASGVGSSGPACLFDGVLTPDGAELRPKNRQGCVETLRQLTEVERRFYGKRLGLLDALTKEFED